MRGHSPDRLASPAAHLMFKTVRTTSTIQVWSLVLLAVVAAVLLGKGVNDIVETREWVAHTREIRMRLQEALVSSTEAELATHRYIFTGDGVDRRTISDAVEREASVLRLLGALAADNPVQAAEAARLEQVCGQSRALNQRLLSTRDTEGAEAARRLISVGADRDITDERRRLVREMDAREKRLLVERQGRFGASIRTMGVMLGLAWVLSLGVLLLGNRAIGRITAARQRAEEALRVANEGLEARVRERTADLERLSESLRQSEKRYRDLVESSPDGIIVQHGDVVVYNNRMGASMLGAPTREGLVGMSAASLVAEPGRPRAQERLRRLLLDRVPVAGEEETWRRLDGGEVTVEVSATYCVFDEKQCVQSVVRDITERRAARLETERINAELERRVLDRTAELRAANEELEAFCYSVSHDLRAPLRAIDGFSRIVLLEHASSFDAEGKRLLGVVRSNTVRMGELIDDLLTFSRLGRQAARAAPVQTETLVREVLAQLVGADPGRPVEVVVGRLPACVGDQNMLRQVWTNLLLNALKFTRHRPDARIEVAGEHENGVVTYHVRDNGVGFDMRYADKLFGVFQRFHRREEFEGTGVGLAIVKRIIDRHAGRVWAEAAVDAGATFWFSLQGAHEE